MAMTPTKHNSSKSDDKKSRTGRAREPGAETAPVKKDDPARDKAQMEDGILQPLPHSD
jgi:hypothetical protein